MQHPQFLREHFAKISMSTRWTNDEDVKLVRAWKTSTVDAVRGTDQASDTFWSTVSNSVPGRDTQACKNRWGRIRLLCQLWGNAVKRVADLKQSGKTAEDLDNDAQKFYETFISAQNAGKKNKAHHLPLKFGLKHCYELLKDCPKFKDLKKVGKRKGSAQETKEAHESNQESNQESYQEEDPRPEGRKAAKKRLRDEREGSSNNVIASESAQAKLDHYRASTRVASAMEATNTMNEEKFWYDFFNNPNCPEHQRHAYFDDKADEYFKKKRQENTEAPADDVEGKNNTVVAPVDVEGVEEGEDMCDEYEYEDDDIDA
jgi:hypothetical protein